MKLSNEAKIGLLVAISLLILFAGFYFLKGANLFSGEHEYYAYYDDVQGLQPASQVQVKGLAVGRVSAIELNGNEKVKVTISVKKSIKVYKGSILKLISADLLGTKAIAVELGAGPEEVENESTLPAVKEGGLIDGISAELTPLILDVRHVVATLDTVLGGVNGMLSPDTRARLEASVASLDVTMKNFSQLSGKLNAESDEMASIIKNANSISSNLAQNNERITNILTHTDVITQQLSAAPVQQTFTDLNATVSQLQGIINKINTNQGSLGMLVNDKDLYNNLSASLKTLNVLMADVNAHPSRYINVTIFGKKNKDKNK
ncbi:MAG: MCE family protein [Sphingobacteriales bacterium]|nr:MAG: MCE family protein [Sphingobacteriales bacterium]